MLILRRPWTSQPQHYVSLDRSNSLLNGALHWWHLTPVFGYRDLIGQSHASLVSASAGTNKDGVSLKFPGGIAYADVGNPADIQFVGADWTIGWQGYLSDPSTRQMLLAKDSDTGSDREFHFQLSSGTLAFVNGVTTVVTATGAIAEAGFYQILYRRSGNTHTIWVNGKSAGSGTNASNYLPKTINLRLGARQYATVEDSLSSGSFIEQVWIVGRAWSDQEIALHYGNNRWRVFSYSQITIPVSADAAPSVPSITAVYADSVGTDRATPRVTLDYA